MTSAEQKKLADIFSKIFIFRTNYGSDDETAEFDRETEELKHETISLNLGKLIQQERQAKGLSQKDLAIKANVKRQIINDYEAGRGVVNDQVLNKIEKVLRTKLRSQDCGKPYYVHDRPKKK